MRRSNINKKAKRRVLRTRSKQLRTEKSWFEKVERDKKWASQQSQLFHILNRIHSTKSK